MPRRRRSSRCQSDPMREIRIPKGGGRYRIVVAPDWRRKRACRDELPRLAAAAITLDVHGVSHGCVPGRGPVSNAAAHRSYRYTLTADLRDCFDNVAPDRLPLAVPDCALHNGAVRQGLPTSPAVANIALAALDAEIIARLAGRGAYTRYVDDMTISSDYRAVIDEMRAWLPDAVRRHGHELAPRKTHLQATPRRVITGVSVADDMRAPRSTRRRLRAAAHRLACLIRDAWACEPARALLLAAAAHQCSVVRGLAEWCAMRPPEPVRAALRATDPLLQLAIMQHAR